MSYKILYLSLLTAIPAAITYHVAYALTTPSFSESIANARKLCFNLCLSHADCKSSNYFPISRICVLNGVSHLDSFRESLMVPGISFTFSETLFDCSITLTTTTEAATSPVGSSGTWIEQALSVTAKPSLQSSTYEGARNHHGKFVASRANDGDANVDMRVNPYCSHTRLEAHPWWQVDLGGKHWLGNITVVNRGDCCGNRLAGATVRAGLSPNITDNMVCGFPVTKTQAQDGARIKFVCDPGILARYVSVDIKTVKTDSSLNICEVMVKEYIKV